MGNDQQGNTETGAQGTEAKEGNPLNASTKIVAENNPDSSEATTAKAHDQAAEREHRENERALVRWTRVVAFLTGGLIIVGAVTGYIFWRQLAVMQGQLTEMQSSSEQVERSIKASNRIADESKTANALTGEANRPWIGASAITVIPSIFEGKDAITTITFSNSGKSPASVIQTRCGTGVMPESPTNPPFALTAIQAQIGSKNIVVPGQAFSCPVRTRAIAPTDLGRVKLSAGQYSFYAYAEIQYRDVATQSEHITHVCWVYNASVDAYVFCTTYNSAN